MVKKSEYRDLFPGALELMILKSLSWRPMHGYALAQRLKDISEDYLQIEEGSLYPALHRMEQSGWVSSKWALTETKRKAKYYKLTPVGRKQLKEAEESFEQLVKGVRAMLRYA